MKKAVRNLITLLTLAALIAVWAVLRTEASKTRSLKTCEGVRVEFADDFRFVTEDDIKGYLDKYFGAYIGQRLDSIRLDKVEDILDVQSAVLKSQAYTTDDKMLNIRITQREPSVRFQKDGQGFYADDKGYIFPLQEHYSSLVPVIDGNVPLNCPKDYKGAPLTDEERKWMAGVTEMIGYMNKSGVWAENIAQIHVDGNGDLVMIPRQGGERFVFGSPFDARLKFDRISDYYKYILPSRGEGYYRTVNVKFDNQIVCKK